MNILKRTTLFVLVNLLIFTTISILINALGVQSYLMRDGIDYQTLAIFCLIWGMTVSIISLLISRWTARIYMGVSLIDPVKAIGEEKQLIHRVYHLARLAGLNTMPQVGIYESTEVNAFATGPTQNKALVAVSSGLLAHMNIDELEGVLAHEISHITNGDMVTMTLLQGTVNAFASFLSHIIYYAIHSALHRENNRDRRNRTRILYNVLDFTLHIFITLLGSIIVAWFSRYREYRADRGGARLAGRHKMIAALERLRSFMPGYKDQKIEGIASLQINRSVSRIRLLRLFSSHPDINLRIKALK